MHGLLESRMEPDLEEEAFACASPSRDSGAGVPAATPGLAGPSGVGCYGPPLC